MEKLPTWLRAIFKPLLADHSFHLFGIEVVVTLYMNLILLAFFVAAAVSIGVLGGIVAVVVLSAVYIIVLMHEFGHCLAARYYGYEVHRISLYPIGGLAQIKGDWSIRPKHEFWITLWGPLVNIFMMIALAPFVLVSEPNPLLLFFFRVNVTLVVFNMLPVFPMDGGRMFRVFSVWVLKDHRRGTRFAHRFGMVLSLCLAVGAWYLGYYTAALLLPAAAFILGSGEVRAREEARDEQVV